jgi:predicted ATPase
MDGKRLIHKLSLSGILSYGPKPMEVELGSLNVLIGPNASGKSNLIAAISLLRAAPGDFREPIRKGGGADEWTWKGRNEKSRGFASIVATVVFADGEAPLIHKMEFVSRSAHAVFFQEAVETSVPGLPMEERYFFERTPAEAPTLQARPNPFQLPGTVAGREPKRLGPEDLLPEQSVLSQIRDPNQYPEITYLAQAYSEIKLYGDWDVGRHSPPRVPQPADLPGDFLLEDASNLGLVVNDLEHQAGGLKAVEDQLRRFYAGIERVSAKVQGGMVQVFFHEKGLTRPIPATRISDGTLRYLCLLTILCHPKPPPLICIEEPEVGLHPDVLPVVAELLVEASRRTQLIVTTHSDLLVSGLSEVPESVLVCEREEGGTTLRRLEKDKLAEWLDKYSLGDLWLKGEIGGTLT